MRQIIATAFFLLLPLSLSAQAVEISSVNERLLNAKVRELVFRLHITHSQKAEFTQIYRRYNEEMTALWTDSRQTAAQPHTAADIAKRKLACQQQAQAVRMKYIDEFAKVLNDSQLARLYEVESIVQRKLMARKRNAYKTMKRKQR